jgi:hypothetical protein
MKMMWYASSANGFRKIEPALTQSYASIERNRNRGGNMVIGDRLKELREAKELSQGDRNELGCCVDTSRA